MDAQIYRLLVLGCVLLGFLFLVCFFIAQIASWGIRLIVFEITGIALVCFCFGLERELTSLIFIAVGMIVAIFIDPLIWRKQKLEASQRTSLLLNGVVGAIGGFAYLLGLWLSKTRP
jgi:branched-subunit amino acid transport protein